MRLFVSRADIDLQMIVAYAAHYITGELVAAESSGSVAVHEADLAASPAQRRFLRGH